MASTAQYFSKTTMIFQKMSEEGILDIEKSHGISVISATPFVPTEVKDAVVVDWHDEHGEDVYDAPQFLKAHDVTFEYGIIGDNAISCTEKFRAFLAYLTSTTNFLVYLPWFESGASGVRYKNASEVNLHREGSRQVLTFKMTFRISEPQYDDKVVVVVTGGDVDRKITLKTID